MFLSSHSGLSGRVLESAWHHVDSVNNSAERQCQLEIGTDVTADGTMNVSLSDFPIVTSSLHPWELV